MSFSKKTRQWTVPEKKSSLNEFGNCIQRTQYCVKWADFSAFLDFRFFTVELILIFGFGDFARCARYIYRRRFGSRCGSHLQWCNAWPLKTRPTAAPETSSGNLSCTPCKIPKTKISVFCSWLYVPIQLLRVSTLLFCHHQGQSMSPVELNIPKTVRL